MGRWDRLLTGFNAALPRLDTDPAAFGPAREALLGFGMGERPNLAWVLADARPEQVVGGIV